MDDIISTTLLEKHHGIIHVIWASFLNSFYENESRVTSIAATGFKLNEYCIQFFQNIFNRESKGTFSKKLKKIKNN